MIRKIKNSAKTICMGIAFLGLIGLDASFAGHGDTLPQAHSESSASRIVFGTVDDVARNLVKVNKDKTEGITPRYIDLSEVKKNEVLQKGDRIKMKVSNHNIVTDYWVVTSK
ncbi:hypothetical protein [Candidatus Nitronereus thalassa]|uniref:DUF1344 domain-containing protein n=1 Tax=Candidatus Nitronereus thalassa TaxID=3020898 RepID=A0ABU3KBB9_9BACT|nr:hypothetical protein [Candidatus Nitronereus thalassa]MDT7043702.1 hypothetical protein [Candidatus Nitronereus thalassa]